MSTEAKTLPRPCWFNNGTTSAPVWTPATLHAWGTDYEEFESGPGLQPIGIVEDASGRIHSIYVTRISLAAESPR